MNAFKQHPPGMYQDPIAAIAVVAAAAGGSKPGNSIVADTFHLSVVVTAFAATIRMICLRSRSSSLFLIAILNVVNAH